MREDEDAHTRTPEVPLRRFVRTARNPVPEMPRPRPLVPLQSMELQ